MIVAIAIAVAIQTHLWILNCNNTILGNNYVYCKITTQHLLILILMYLHKDEIRVHNKVNEKPLLS